MSFCPVSGHFDPQSEEEKWNDNSSNENQEDDDDDDDDDEYMSYADSFSDYIITLTNLWFH